MNNKYTVYPMFARSQERTIYANSTKSAIKKYVSFENMQLDTDKINYNKGHYYNVDGTNIFVQMIG
ncbi:MAG: hypothetical protein ACPG5O_12765 [Pseudoalteromonas tetraodonis]